MGVIDAPMDPVTVAQWSQHAHMSVSALRQLCRAAGVRPKLSLDTARILRAVVWLQLDSWMPEAVLDCRDPRTLTSLLERTGCSKDFVRGRSTPSPRRFLSNQTLLPQDGIHLQALRRALDVKTANGKEFSSAS
ncbi:MAG: hypothetical protein AAF725_23885 [Acidobacteriota bacterium]